MIFADSSDEWWRCGNCPSPDEWSAVFAGLTLLVASVAAIVALIQVKEYLNEQRDRRRPYVVVDFAFSGSSLMRVEIRNISSSPAMDLQLSVSPPFESSRQDDSATVLNEVFDGRTVISMLAPGRRILYSLDTAYSYREAGLTRRYDVTATYHDATRSVRAAMLSPSRRPAVTYSDRYVLDFAQWEKTAVETDYANKNWNIASRVETRVASIDGSLRAIAAASTAREKQVAKKWPRPSRRNPRQLRRGRD